MDERYIPSVLKTNTPMMLLQLAWKCPECGGRAEANIVSCEQTDAVTKNFVGNYAKRRMCARCMERRKIRLLDEAQVTFIPEKQFTRWASGLPEKTPKGERVSKG